MAMAGKIWRLLLLLIIITTLLWPVILGATDKQLRVPKWQVTDYKKPSFLGWDQAYFTSYQDTIEITIYICLSEYPATFNLVVNAPYQFFYAERDTNWQIAKCVFQKGMINEEKRNSNWPTSVIRKFLGDPKNTANLPPKVANLLETAFRYAKINFTNQKTGSK